jgi:RNA polymerase sigma-70 factor, ECF subfamily
MHRSRPQRHRHEPAAAGDNNPSKFLFFWLGEEAGGYAFVRLPMEDRRSAILRLTQGASQGDAAAAADLLPLVYDELRAIAASMLRGERAGHTLQPTALVNEAYLKIAGGNPWEGRQHFQAVAAIAMRQILVNHARERGARKRGGGDWSRVTLSDIAEQAEHASREIDLLALDEALLELERLDPTQARIVEMRYFAGLSNADVAAFLNVSERTVMREWRMARAWLGTKLWAGGPEDSRADPGVEGA